MPSGLTKRQRAEVEGIAGADGGTGCFIILLSLAVAYIFICSVKFCEHRLQVIESQLNIEQQGPSLNPWHDYGDPSERQETPP